MRPTAKRILSGWGSIGLLLLAMVPDLAAAERTAKPALHARHWMAITGNSQ